MNKKKFIIIAIISIIVIIAALIILILHNLSKEKNQAQEYVQPDTSTSQNEEDDSLVVMLGNNVEEEQVQEEPEQPAVKDATTLTQEVYDVNGPIGTLNIPKTGLNTQVYSRVTASQMEQMPCFLYTTGGLNQKGFTLFVGHNRENGLLFSNNNMLEENDEFYFTDLNGTEKKYTVFSKFVTSSDDVSFYHNEYDSPVIAMQCCLSANISDQVIIVMGKAEN